MKISASVILRFSEAPVYHAVLTRTLGEPSVCFSIGEPSGLPNQEQWDSSLWALESPVSDRDNVREHLAWASNLVTEHYRFIKELMEAGVDVSLHIGTYTKDSFVIFELDPQLLKPFVDLSVRLEIYTGLISD